MEFKKNDRIEISISDIGVNGEGIGKTDGCTFFVKDALPGDRVEAVITKMKKGYGYAKMLRILQASSCRIEAPCVNARRCGGCQLLEMDYGEQLRVKEQKVRNNLEKIGGFQGIEVLPVLGMKEKETSLYSDTLPLRYRNKMQFPIGRDKDGNLAAGFYAGRTHAIINTNDCVIAPEALSRILCAVKAFLEKHRIAVYNETTGQGLVRHLVLRMGFRTGEIMVCLVLNGSSLNEGSYSGKEDLEKELTDELLRLPLSCGCRKGANLNIASICINENRENTNVILGRKVRCVYGRPFIYDEIVNRKTGSRLRFKISPLSFYQVNPVQMEVLYSKALEFAQLTGTETVWDLYCGTGTISLFLAQEAKQVMGVEIVPEAIRDAKENAQRNGIENAQFFCGKSEEVFPQYRRIQERAAEEGLSGDAEDQSGMTPLAGSGEGQSGTKRMSAGAEILSSGGGVLLSVQESEGDTVVVLDPPRKGCDRKLLDAISEAAPDRIVYVSCDSATLARDLKILCDPEKKTASYQIQKIQPVDMFPNSIHVECVTLLQKLSNGWKKNTTLDVEMEDYHISLH